MAEGSSGGGAGNDLLFVVVVLVVLALIWAGTGGIERARQDPGYFLKPPAPLGTDATYGRSLSDGIEQSSKGIEESFSKAQQELKRVSTEIGKTVSYGMLSPYHGLVHFGGYVSSAGAGNPAQEYVEIDYNGDGAGRIPITGWTLLSAISNIAVSIPQGARTPASGALSFVEPIYLSPGDSAYVITGRSPLGISFLPNKCVGYFEQYQSFIPSLYRSCPAPTGEIAYAQDQNLRADNACYDFVSTLPSCQMHSGSFNQPLSESCKDFIQNDLTYTGCVRNHRSDADFYAKDWRIYLSRDQSLWRDRREVLKLLDMQGLTVDVLTY